MDFIKERGMEVGEVLQERYQIRRLLGKGGAGRVYLVEDLRLSGKTWALKQIDLSDDQSSELARQNFTREAEVLSRLKHPKLPGLVDFFGDERHQYLVREYVEGRSLTEFLKSEGPQEESVLLRWATSLGEVLEYLHGQDPPVVFRDLKPDNVIVTPEGEVRMIDFGLARHFDPDSRQDTVASGSVGYAPPEQWDESRPTDARSDIYSLGATLYHVLTAKPPSAIYGSIDVRRHRPGVDTGVETMLMRCLQAEPEQRYGSMGELLKDVTTLTRRLEGDLEVGEPPPREASKPEGSSLYLWVLALVVGFAILAGARWWNTPPIPAESRLVKTLRATRPLKQAIRDKLSAGDLTGTLAELNSLVTVHPEDPEVHILRNNVTALLAGEVKRVPVVTTVQGREPGGVQLLAGLALAQEQLNREAIAHGGNRFVLDVFDDGGEVETCLAQLEKVAAHPDYLVGVGPYSSQHANAVVPLLESVKFTMITPTAADRKIWGMSRHLMVSAEPARGRIRTIAQYFADQGMTRAAVLTHEQSLASRAHADDFVEYFEERGGEVVFHEFYRSDLSEVEPHVEEMVRVKADVVFVADYRIAEVHAYFLATRRAGLKVPVGCHIPPFDRSWSASGLAPAEGLVTTCFFNPRAEDPEVKKFTRRFERMFGGFSPYHREAVSYDTLILLAEAFEKAGTSRQKMREFLSSVESRTGVAGEFGLARRLEKRTAYVVKIENGEFTFVD